MNEAASDPQVPGPGFRFPIPKKVAIKDAQSGAGAVADDCFAGASVFIALTGKARGVYFVRDIAHRRRDHVLAAGPFTKINQPATFAAKREVLGRSLHGLLADRAFEFCLLLAWHSSILDRIGAPDERW